MEIYKRQTQKYEKRHDFIFLALDPVLDLHGGSAVALIDMHGGALGEGGGDLLGEKDGALWINGDEDEVGGICIQGGFGRGFGEGGFRLGLICFNNKCFGFKPVIQIFDIDSS